MNHLIWCRWDYCLGLHACLRWSAEREPCGEEPAREVGKVHQPHVHLSVPKRSLPTDLHCCGLEPPRHLSPCDNHILSPIPKPIWSKLYPTSQKDTTVNFNLTQVPISLLVTALPACLSAMTETHSLSTLQFPSGHFGSSLLLFTKRRV